MTPEIQKAIAGAEALCKKLRSSPKNDTYENYGQKEKRAFLDKLSDYQAQGHALEVFNNYGF